MLETFNHNAIVTYNVTYCKKKNDFFYDRVKIYYFTLIICIVFILKS